MGTEGTVLGVVIAVVGVIGSVLVARVSVPRPQPVGHPEPDEVPPALEVSPEIWSHFSGKITNLEAKVDHLTDLVEQQTVRVGTLERLLRQAMRVIRRCNTRLRKAGLDPEPIPPELIPYSID
ncbi:hypothetical protein [Streptomyces sp. NBC_01233]|uniref:hypothetical protein n=1 Tax=Streptomyces sp. NBC_01233 TaxID=2903787 RepID=UPI002E0EDF75|nr:hypothetical protein OG332_10785 [Streptomyces sp. NBC_01233]